MDKDSSLLIRQVTVNKPAQVALFPILDKLIKLSQEMGWHIAVWRLPYHEEIQMLIDLDQPKEFDKLDFESEDASFVVAPFSQSEDLYKVLLKGDITFNSQDNQLRSPNGRVDIADFLQQVKKYIPGTESISGKQPISDRDQNVDDEAKSKYLKLVEKSIEYIDWGKFEKVVPSRTKKIKLKDFSFSTAYSRLSTEYPRAFVYLISGPAFGTWMGATPELLLEIEDKKLFRTVSLAGTQPYDKGVDLGSVAWKQKEIEEQALVSRYIINCFKKIRLREFEEKGPKTAVAGNLMHLKTSFEVDMEETGFSNLGSVMLELLHPTSAVCGMPKEEAMEFLKKNELHERKLFSGFIGPVNVQNDSHLFVNLRCMKVEDSEATLYAGAGITEHSNPENEWNETEIKCETLLKVISEFVI